MDGGTSVAREIRSIERRTRRPNNHRRSRRINLRLDDGEWSTIHAVAASVGMSDAGWCSEVALAAATGTAPPTPSISRDALGEMMDARLELRRVANNLNQAVAALHSTGVVPDRLQTAIADTSAAVRKVDDVAETVNESLRP